MKNKPTEKEHYIPQTYLRAFSVPEDDRMIIQYDLDVNPVVSRRVPIKTICYKKNLYEIKNSEGEIVRQNYLENCLNVLEGLFANNRRKLFAKANKINLGCKSFLSNEEKAFWKLYIALQLLRYPEALQTAEEAFEEFLIGESSGEMTRDIAKLYCLPFLGSYDPEDRNVLTEELKLIEPLDICVEICQTERFITSDRPIFAYSPTFPKEIKLEQIVFPLSPKVQLLLHTHGEQNHSLRNILHLVNEEETSDAIRAMGFAANRFVYANRTLDEKEIEVLRLGHKDKPLAIEKNMSKLARIMEVPQ